MRSGKKEKQPAWFLIKSKDEFVSDLEANDLMDKTMRESTKRAAKSSAITRTAKKSTARRKVAPTARPRSLSSLVSAASALDGAVKATVESGFFKPELAKLRDEPPVGEQWLHEVKWDGYRILATIEKGEVELWSRNGLPWTDKLPDIAQAVKRLGLQSGRLDGELVAMDNKGRSDFNALQKALSGDAPLPLVYMLFDMPTFQGWDLTRVALRDRKTLLQRLVGKSVKPLAFSSHSNGDGKAAYAMAMDQKLEGIISKRADSPYRSGRADDWLKIKRLASDEFAVVGYTLPKGSRSGFGSLLLAAPDPDVKAGWRYAGRVGSGFSDADLKGLSKTLATKGDKKPPVPLSAIDPLLRGALWVKPSAVVEVFYRGIGNHQLLRSPA